MAYAGIGYEGGLQIENTITKSGAGHGPNTFPNLQSKLE